MNGAMPMNNPSFQTGETSAQEPEQHILLVDDDKTQHKLIQVFLKMIAGKTARLESMFCLENAKQALIATSFDIILLDNRLSPYTHYEETWPQLRKYAGNTPVYVISANTDELIETEAKDQGVAGIIDKYDLRSQLGVCLARLTDG